nr:carboxylesterase [Hyphantria cunea]
MKEILLIFLAISTCLECAPDQDFVVETLYGPVRGVQNEKGDFTMFLGVPYGIVDEDNPFGDAKPPAKFDSVYDAVSDSTLCPQYSGRPVGEIDCLKLNIYAPNHIKPKEKLPVMFYIPGGAFIGNNPNREISGPELLMKHDIVLVTINYRAGIYGFLCLDIPGYNNQGLKDQVLALKWIKENIESFGGDPNKITVFGQSAGAMSIDMMLLVKEPLFQRAIIQSGVALTPWIFDKHTNIAPVYVAKELGFKGDDVKAALDYLKGFNALDVINATNSVNVYGTYGHPLTRPCVESNNDDAVLPDYPVNLKPKVKDLDIMIGHTLREASFRYPVSDASYYNSYTFDIELRQEFNELLDEQLIRNLYIKDEITSLTNRPEILDFASDFAFAHPTERTVDRYIDAGARSVYKYLFTYEGDRNGMSKKMNTNDGSIHGDDMGYLWNGDGIPDEANAADQKMIDIMTKLFTDFAKYGNPTPSGPTPLIPVNWEPAVGDRRPYLLIDEPLSMENRLFNERMVFWDMYYKLHGDKVKGRDTK